MTRMPPVRLTAYLTRLRLTAPPAATADGLASLQSAHRQTIAFENLDILLDRPIRISSDHAFDKLVTRQRGGYCFEQNRLFSDMLAALGFPNRPLLARVHLGLPADIIPPRTHVLLLVDLNGAPWIADAGFGAGYVPPMPLQDGAIIESPDGATHRLRRIGQPGDLTSEWLLERRGPVAAMDARAAQHEDWQPQYAFDLSAVAPDDLEQCNHWTSTRAGTRFLTLAVVSVVLPDGFATMTDRRLSLYRGRTSEVREIADAAEYQALLTGLFGLSVSAEEVAALPIFGTSVSPE